MRIKEKLVEVDEKLSELKSVMGELTSAIEDSIEVMDITKTAKELEKKAKDVRKALECAIKVEKQERKEREIIKRKGLPERVIDIKAVLSGGAKPKDIEELRNAYLEEKRREHEKNVAKDIERIRDMQRKELEKIKVMKDAVFYSEAAKQEFDEEKEKSEKLRSIRVF